MMNLLKGEISCVFSQTNVMSEKMLNVGILKYPVHDNSQSVLATLAKSKC